MEDKHSGTFWSDESVLYLDSEFMCACSFASLVLWVSNSKTIFYAF